MSELTPEQHQMILQARRTGCVRLSDVETAVRIIAAELRDFLSPAAEQARAESERRAA